MVFRNMHNLTQKKKHQQKHFEFFFHTFFKLFFFLFLGIGKVAISLVLPRKHFFL